MRNCKISSYSFHQRFCSRIDNLQESINSEREANCPMFDREFRTRINNWAQRLDNLDNLHTFADSELRELRSIADDLAALFDNYAEYFESINELSTMEMRLQRLRGELRTNEMHLREEVWNGIYFLGSVTLGVVTVGAFVKYYRKNLMNIIQYGLKNMKK